MRKWMIWILIGIFLVVIGIASFKWWQLVYRVELRADELSAANAALARGISIDDKLNDFVIMEKNDEKPNENNPSPYRLPVVDIKNMKVGSDNKYLYIKVQFYEKNSQKILHQLMATISRVWAQKLIFSTSRWVKT